MSFQMWTRPVLAFALVAAALAQDPAVTTPEFTIGTGTKVPLSLINSVSTKHSAEGDRVYLETVFPVLVNGRIVVPVGSYVAGTVTQLKKPGRTKGRGELYVRFDSLTLPNGVTRDFHARIGATNALHRGYATEVDEGVGPLGAVLEPVVAVLPAGQQPALLHVLRELRGAFHGVGLVELERRHHVA